VRDLMHSIKFKGQRQVAQGLGLLMAEYAKDWDINGDYIIPVPLHPSKKWSRGFNQATVLAKPLSKALKIPLSENMLRRIKKTTPQNQLNSHQRIENLEGAFLFDKKRYKPDTVILVDDIFTSGSTMSACAKVLKDSGVKRVLCVSLSIALKEMED
jgi:ComF family protein